MPLIGWLATGSVHRYVEAFDHWIAFTVFLLLGLNVIIDARRGNKEEKAPCVLSLRLLFCVGIATSIDACVAGISLYFMNVGILTAALMIGIVCFVCTLAGFMSVAFSPAADLRLADCGGCGADFARCEKYCMSICRQLTYQRLLLNQKQV